MRHESFAALILTHGRADRVHTYETIRRSGYTGRIVLVVDDQDRSLREYVRRYGSEVKVFDKEVVAARIDTRNNFPERRGIVFARNASWDVAEEIGVSHFVQLDDDYTDLHHRVASDGRYLSSCRVRDLDAIFDALVDFLDVTPALSVALAQGGDLFAGQDEIKLRRLMRKCMNSFLCRTDRRFRFDGLLNEDVNAYTTLAATGALFFTVSQAHLNQVQTQASEGGMTGLYSDGGTYVKSFYTVMGAPSCVQVAAMGSTRPRLHHGIDWPHAVPRIVGEDQRKARPRRIRKKANARRR